MSESMNLGLSYLEAAQAQKHVTVNEALSRLDALVHLTVISRVLATPPITPVLGDRYLLPPGTSGEWATHPGQLAMWLEGVWAYVTPREGWRLWVADEDVLLAYTGSSWAAGAVPTSLQNMQQVGVNAVADSTNKLVVSSSASLFNHAGSGHQVKLNKNLPADTASMMWQTGFSGRAELGTTGDDDFHFKVSADGTAWLEALTINRSTGVVTLPQGVGALPVFGSTLKGVVPPSGGGTIQFLRADGGWAVPPGTATAAGVMSSDGLPYRTGSGRWLTNSVDATALTTSLGVANRIELAPWVAPLDYIIDQVGVLCATAVVGALGKIVCYSSDADGRPTILMFETASLDFGTVGFKSLAQAASFVRGGVYWLGLHTSSTASVNAHQPDCSPVLGFASPPTVNVNKVLRRSVTFASASPAAWGWSAAEEASSNVPAIFLRVV